MTGEVANTDRKPKAAKLAEYRELALSIAESLRQSPEHQFEALVLSANDISFEPFQGREVQQICRDRCPLYETSAICFDFWHASENRERLKQAGDAVLIVIKVPVWEVTDPRWPEPEYSGKGKRVISRLLRALEEKARADGFAKSFGLGSGPCKNVWCVGKNCPPLEGDDPCRYPTLAKTAMEGFGINVVDTLARQGIPMYYIGEGMAEPDSIPYAVCAGLLVVG